MAGPYGPAVNVLVLLDEIRADGETTVRYFNMCVNVAGEN